MESITAGDTAAEIDGSAETAIRKFHSIQTIAAKYDTGGFGSTCRRNDKEQIFLAENLLFAYRLNQCRR